MKKNYQIRRTHANKGIRTPILSYRSVYAETLEQAKNRARTYKHPALIAIEIINRT
tara:strand:- start:144 stop:311 length:168 start_codon:yes stop_codon:yes gene_type:complete